MVHSDLFIFDNVIHITLKVPLIRIFFPVGRKIGQGQPRVIIYIYFVELESPMLHAKFQDHRTYVQEIKIF